MKTPLSAATAVHSSLAVDGLPQPRPGGIVLPSARSAWIATGILTLTYVLAYIDRQVVAILAEPIKRDLGLSDTGIGLIIGIAFFLSYSLAAIPIGQLVDVVNRRRLLAVGVAAWSLLTAASGAASSFWQLFAARALVGVGEATVFPAGASIIGDYFPPHRRMRAMTVLVFGAALGGALAYMLGGVLLKAFAPLDGVPLPIIGIARPWKLVFLSLGAIGLVFTVVVLLIKEPARAQDSFRAEAGSGIREGFVYLLSEGRGLLAIIVSLGFMMLVVFAMIAWLPALFLRRFDWPSDKTGAVIGAIALTTGIIGMLLANVVAERFSRRDTADAIPRAALWFCGLGALPMIGSALLPTGEMVALALFPALTFAMGFTPITQGAIQLSVPSRMRGRVTGFYVLIVSLFSAALGPSVAAFFTDFVFRDEMMLHYSLAATGALSIPVAFGLLLYGRKRFATLVRNSQA